MSGECREISSTQTPAALWVLCRREQSTSPRRAKYPHQAAGTANISLKAINYQNTYLMIAFKKILLSFDSEINAFKNCVLNSVQR